MSHQLPASMWRIIVDHCYSYGNRYRNNGENMALSVITGGLLLMAIAVIGLQPLNNWKLTVCYLMLLVGGLVGYFMEQINVECKRQRLSNYLYDNHRTMWKQLRQAKNEEVCGEVVGNNIVKLKEAMDQLL